jgi:hypothetical protein
MTEDRELETWREQWCSVAEPLPELHKKIKHQNLFFVISNIAAGLTFVAALIFATWAVRQEPSRLRISWAVGIGVLVFVCAGYRIWAQRGTWHSEAQSTRAFVELWHRRLVTKIRLIRMAFYLISVWIVFCGLLAAANWSVIGPDVHAHPTDWLRDIGILIVGLVGVFVWLTWYRQRKLARLDEVKKLLDGMKD